jgi:hypothetical protein
LHGPGIRADAERPAAFKRHGAIRAALI